MGGGTGSGAIITKRRGVRSLLPWPSFTVLVTTVAINLLALAIPLFSIQVYDRIIAQRGYSTLYVLGIGVGAALLLEMVLRLLRSWLIGRAAATNEAQLSTLAFQALAHADLLTLQQKRAGMLQQSFQAIGRLREFHSGQAFITLLELPFGVLYLCGIAYLSGPLVLVPLLLLVSFAIRAIRLGTALQAIMASRDAADRARYAFLSETLAGIHTLKAYGAEPRQLRRYEALQDTVNTSNYKAVAIANLAAGDGALYGQLMLGSMVLCGAWLAGGGWQGHPLSLGALIACVLLAGRVMQPVQRAFGLWHRFQEGQLSERQLQRLHRLHRAPAQVATHPGTAGPAAVCLRAVDFSYGDQPLLQQISLTLPAGGSISIDGPAGCGKSTLLRLIGGLYQPQAGTITIDGAARQSQQDEAVQVLPGVAYLRPSAGILRGSIADNLTRFGAVRLADMLPLARLLRLDQDIARLPRGYATPLLGTQADSVTPGFKQRLTLARALAPTGGQAPRLVLYDDADRGLDAHGYSVLLALLGRLASQTTLVLVSADSNVRALAARHYHLQQGRLHEIANTGIRSQLALRQATLGPALSELAL